MVVQRVTVSDIFGEHIDRQGLPGYLPVEKHAVSAAPGGFHPNLSGWSQAWWFKPALHFGRNLLPYCGDRIQLHSHRAEGASKRVMKFS